MPESEQIDGIDDRLVAVQGYIAGISKPYHQPAQLRQLGKRPTDGRGGASNAAKCRAMTGAARLAGSLALASQEPPAALQPLSSSPCRPSVVVVMISSSA